MHAAMPRRRSVLQGAGGLAGILALGKAPAIAQTQPTKLVIAHITPVPESGAVALDWFAKAMTERSKGELQVEFHGGTLLTKEIDVMNGVKTGSIAIGTPSGAAATIFPEMGVFLVGYLISSYDQAYKILNGKVGDQLDKTFQEKYGVKVLYYFDYGFRHFWNATPPDQRTARPARPEDPHPAIEGVHRHGERHRRGRGAAGLGRGDHRRAAGRDRWRRPAGRQHGAAEGLRGFQILLDDRPQLRLDPGGDEPRHVERACGPTSRS